MPDRKSLQPLCITIAGPNGAGKTTFAREFLQQETGVIHFVNADLIAQGLSPLRPELAAISAARVFLNEIQKLASSREDFAFEPTLSGLTYIRLLKKWKASGYRIEIVYLKLPSPDLAVSRISTRVKQGGHAVPKADVVRRFNRSWRNFIGTYRALADSWTIYDNAGTKPIVVDRSHEKAD